MIERSTGVTPEQLVPAHFPVQISYIWEWFRDMCRMRQSNGMDVSHLCTEIATWQTLTGNSLTTFELETIWQLDAVFIHHQRQKAPK